MSDPSITRGVLIVSLSIEFMDPSRMVCLPTTMSEVVLLEDLQNAEQRESTIRLESACSHHGILVFGHQTDRSK
jgi:hypothetical protein